MRKEARRWVALWLTAFLIGLVTVHRCDAYP